jgi:hypothetical protein
MDKVQKPISYQRLNYVVERVSFKQQEYIRWGRSHVTPHVYTIMSSCIAVTPQLCDMTSVAPSSGGCEIFTVRQKVNKASRT